MGTKLDLPRLDLPDPQRDVLDALAEAGGETVLNGPELATRYRRPYAVVHNAIRRLEDRGLIAHVRNTLPQGKGRGLRVYRLRMAQVARLAADMSRDCAA